jgi:hypothetical protein
MALACCLASSCARFPAGQAPTRGRESTAAKDLFVNIPYNDPITYNHFLSLEKMKLIRLDDGPAGGGIIANTLDARDLQSFLQLAPRTLFSYGIGGEPIRGPESNWIILNPRDLEAPVAFANLPMQLKEALHAFGALRSRLIGPRYETVRYLQDCKWAWGLDINAQYRSRKTGDLCPVTMRFLQGATAKQFRDWISQLY